MPKATPGTLNFLAFACFELFRHTYVENFQLSKMLSARTLNFQLSMMLSARTLKGPSLAALTQNALSRSVWSAGECVAASAGAAGASARRAIRGLLTCMSTGLLAPTNSAATGRRPTATGPTTGCRTSVTRPQGFRLRSDAEQMFQKKKIGIPVAEECRSSRDTKGALHGGVSSKRTLVAVGTRRRLRTDGERTPRIPDDFGFNAFFPYSEFPNLGGAPRPNVAGGYRVEPAPHGWHYRVGEYVLQMRGPGDVNLVLSAVDTTVILSVPQSAREKHLAAPFRRRAALLEKYF